VRDENTINTLGNSPNLCLLNIGLV